MPGRASPYRPRALLLAAALLAALFAAGAVRAQAQDEPSPAPAWDRVSTNAEERVADADTSTPALDQLREQLVQVRSEALEVERAAEPAVNELNERVKALGPPPAEGAADPPEIAARRQDLQRQISAAQAPILEAQEAYQRADALIKEIDRIVRDRFSAELMSRGPTPLRPQVWLAGLDEVHKRLLDNWNGLTSGLEDPVHRTLLLRSLPLSIGLVIAGLVVAVALRRWLIDWVERRLDPGAGYPPEAWIVAVRNLARLVVPAVGAGLLFAAFDPQRWVAQPADERLFYLPSFVLILIGAGWLAAGLLAPKHAVFRLVPLDDGEAQAGARVVIGLGIVLALALLFSRLTEHWDLSTTTQTALQFPLVLFGAAGLWRAAGLIDVARQRLAGPADAGTSTMRSRFFRILVRALRAVAVAAPLLALAGFLTAAGFLVMRSAATLGLMGSALVIFDLVNRTAQSFLRSPTASSDDGGLVPVVVGALIGLVSLPLLAMIWGARPSDISDAWMLLKEGVTFGGIRLSAGIVLTLMLVFAIGVGATRLLQTVLRGTVLPRTRLDTGGRNAVLAGTGYVGFTLAALAAIGAAGLDLSNIAIVAGALSVGIGFGLQNVVSNFVSGIILLVERPVKEGDWIEVGGFSGYVRGISVRSTEIETFDRASVILPNSDLIAGTVLNRTHVGMSGRLQVPVGVTWEADPRKVEAILLSIAEEHPLVLADPAPRVLFLDLGPDSMNFELRCWLRDVNFSLSARSDMNFEIVERFRAEGIRVQFTVATCRRPRRPSPLAVALQRAMKELPP